MRLQILAPVQGNGLKLDGSACPNQDARPVDVKVSLKFAPLPTGGQGQTMIFSLVETKAP